MTKQDLLMLIENTFGIYAIKKVSKTDINRSAYVPNLDQKKIFESHEINPFERRQDIKIKELFTNKILIISYYATLRVGSNRSPEPRMGLSDLISYLTVDDEILFTSDGNEIFIYNLSKLSNDNTINEENFYSQVNIDILKKKVSTIDINPSKIEQKIQTYKRNNLLRSYIKQRSNYTCEMPKCNYASFTKSNGEKYIEIHHIMPLSEGGEDSIENTIALCPNCHREIHHSKNKEKLNKLLINYLKTLQ